MIEDVKTGRFIPGEVRPVDAGDFDGLEQGWRFDWRAEVRTKEIFKLIDPATPGAILGLLALQRCANYVEVTLLESHPEQVGRTKQFRGIADSLFAFAAQLSFELGGAGFVAIDAKTELIEHYQRTYGFERVGKSQRMILGTVAAQRPISTYGGRPGHE
jgi:hypothetical protein